jgi:hypothetical protein
MKILNLLSFLLMIIVSFNSVSQERDDMYFNSDDRVNKVKAKKKNVTPADVILKNYRKNLSDYDASKNIDPLILNKYKTSLEASRLDVTLKSLKYNRDNLYVKSNKNNKSRFFNSMSYSPYLYNYRIFDPFSYERINSLTQRRMLLRALSFNPLFAIDFFSNPYYSSLFPHMSPIDFWGSYDLSYGMGRCIAGFCGRSNSLYGYNYGGGSNSFGNHVNVVYNPNPNANPGSDETKVRGPRNGRGNSQMNGENLTVRGIKITRRGSGITMSNIESSEKSIKGITQNQYIRGKNSGNIDSDVSRLGIRSSVSQEFNSRKSSNSMRRSYDRLSLINEVNNQSNSRSIGTNRVYDGSSDGRNPNYSRPSTFQSSGSNRGQGGVSGFSNGTTSTSSNSSRSFSSGSGTSRSSSGSSSGGGAVSGGSSGGSSRGSGNN